MIDTITVGSLFSGIGGLDLGLERAGMRVIWQCESDSYCRAVLRKHWPDVPCYADVRDIGADVPRSDLLCGGFPCQPVSVAGKRLGTKDERWLWPEFARCIRLLRPRLVLLENVPGLLGGPMGDVLGDLAASGYDAEWDCIPAAAVGAPHLRYRVFIVAYHDGYGCDVKGDVETGPEGAACGPVIAPGEQRTDSPLADADREREPESSRTVGKIRRWSSDGRQEMADPDEHARLERRPGDATEITGGGGADRSRLGPMANPERNGLEGTEHAFSGQGADGWRRRLADPDWWLTEPDVGRVAHGVPSRVDRLRTLGNAVVPQVAEAVGRMILEGLAAREPRRA